MNELEFNWLDAQQAQRELQPLCEVLEGCVALGASVGFVERDMTVFQRFWQDTVLSLACGDRLLLVARLQGRIVATVMVVLAMPPNGMHRAEIVKLLVHPDARRRGIARQLMQQAEERARAAGRSLLTLDTRSGDTGEALYASLGWLVAGQIPDYACSVTGVREATTLMYKLV